MADGDRPDASEPRFQEDDEQPLSEQEQLEQELDSLRGKVDAYLDLAQRTQADFANYKKRIERERESDVEIAQAAIVRSLLPIIDDFDRARAAATSGTNNVVHPHAETQARLHSRPAGASMRVPQDIRTQPEAEP